MSVIQDRTWLHQALRRIEADFARSGDTHLVRLDLPRLQGIDVYLKDESIHPTGSLKHRLARSLFLHALCNGWIGPDTLVIESSSGNTAVSEAYFAQLLGLKFIAVVPADTSTEKVELIQFYGGICRRVDSATNPSDECRRLAIETGGHFMDQFTYAERATDWRGNNNIAESIFEQMRHERFLVPTWIACGAGTGGTSATIGRFIRYKQLRTRLCVADPENSVYFEAHRTGRRDVTCGRGPGVEGIGRCQVEPSFIPSVIDRCVRIPNAASFAAMHYLQRLTGRRYGGSTGTSFFALAGLIAEMERAGEVGSVVTLICDVGDRYLSTYYDAEWLTRNGYVIQPFVNELQALFERRDVEKSTSPSMDDCLRSSERIGWLPDARSPQA